MNILHSLKEKMSMVKHNETCQGMTTEMSERELILDDLPKIINMKHTITYIGIGSAYNEEHAAWTPDEDQQYPYFIRKYKECVNNVPINLVLIDPQLDIIPCMKDLKLLTDNKNTIKYTNIMRCQNNITLYMFKQPVVYVPHLMTFEVTSNNFDITSTLEQMNKKCIQENGILIVHDFSGYDIWILDKYFSAYTNGSNTQILYDLSDGTQEGCYIDLKNPINHISFEKANDFIRINNIIKKPLGILRQYLIGVNKWHYSQTEILKVERRCELIIREFIAYVKHHLKALRWKKSFDNNGDHELCKRVIKERELRILDMIYSTNFVELHQKNAIYKYVEVSERILNAKKNDIELLLDITVDLPNNKPEMWLNILDTLFTK